MYMCVTNALQVQQIIIYILNKNNIDLAQHDSNSQKKNNPTYDCSEVCFKNVQNG